MGLQMKELVLDASSCDGGCKYVRRRLQVRAMTVASTCDGGCKYVRLYKALLAQELSADPGKTNLSKEGG